MSEIWTIKTALEWTVGYLERKGDLTPLLSAQWLLSEATGLSRVELYVNYDRPLSSSERDLLRGFVTRRGRGEPLQYITGSVSFRHITVRVRPGVLIPRPETEVLVSEVLSSLPASLRRHSIPYRSELVDDEGNGSESESCAEGASAEDEGLLVADICTGSGCVACSLAYENPCVRVVASDIDRGAVALAEENVTALGLADRVTVICGDLGESVPSDLLGRFDAVVSNPPYVPTALLSDIPSEVRDFEPALALDGGVDGLDVFRRLLEWAHGALGNGGLLACELHETNLDAAADLALSKGFSDVRIVLDLADRPRVLVARKA